MAYNQSGQYNSHGSQYNDHRSYYAPPQDEYTEPPAEGYYAQTASGAQSQLQWTNGSSYGQYPPSTSQSYQDSSLAHSTSTHSQSPGYGSGYDYGEQPQSSPDVRSSSGYNPQQYAQPAANYSPQAYGAVNHQHPSYSSSQQTYNPAAYADPYGRPRSCSNQQQYTYQPSSYASPNPSHAQSTSYGYPSPALSQQSHSSTYYTPPMGYSQHATFGSSRLSSTPEIPQSQTYSTYSQPAPQMATSYQSPPTSESYDHYNSYGQRGSASTPSNTQPSVSPALPGLPDEHYMPSPPTYSPFNHGQSTSESRDRGSVSPVPRQSSSNAVPAPPAHAPHRTDTLSRHPQARPLPGPPEPDIEPDYYRGTTSNDQLNAYDEERLAQDELFTQVENAVMNAGSPSQPQTHSRNGSNRSMTNGHFSTGSPSRQPPRYHETDSGDESDPEAAAGLAAMHAAEAEDAAHAMRRQSTGSVLSRRVDSQLHLRGSTPATEYSGGYETDNYGTVDMSSFGGGADIQVSYGGDPNTLAGAAANGTYSQTPSSTGSLRRGHDSRQSYDYATDNIHPFPAFSSTARVDSGGTGGLTDPGTNPRRQSYDEGDDYTFHENDAGVSGPAELFYHPDVSPYRPLPPPPPSSSSDPSREGEPTLDHASLPPEPSGYVQSASGIWVPRSVSLLHHSNTPSINQPARAKTDAEEQRRKQGYRVSSYSTFDQNPATSAVDLDLPSLPTKRFNPAKLGAAEFKRCEEPWALSALFRWLKQVADPEQNTELRASMLKDALVALFTNKVPTMNIADAEVLSDLVVGDMYAAGTLHKQEEWVRFSPGTMSGVVFQLTRSGCYSPTVHDHVVPGRCYSHFCQRTLRKVSLQGAPSRATEDWATFYKVKKEDVEGIDKKEVERQNILHEIVQTEDGYMEQLNVLRLLYRDPLNSSDPPVVDPKRLKSFSKEVFGKVDAVKKANEDHLLPQLKYRQNEQGPFITGFSDIFRQWIRKAKTAYVDYAAGFPGATLMMRQELESNLDFRAFVDRARSNKLSSKLGWDTYLKAPITRLQRYSLLLSTVHKNMKQESGERSNLELAIEEIKAVTLECDSRVAEMQRKVDLADLGQKLILRPGMKDEVELNLNHLGRELIYRGDLQRTGGTRFNWLDCHALLFDHYFILAKTVAVQQRGFGGKVEKYDVSRLPIPMDLLMLESINEDPVMKSSYVRGITSVSSVPTRTSTADPRLLTRTSTNQTPQPGLTERSSTSTSLASLHTVNSNQAGIASATVTEAGKDSDRIVYPIRIKHLGRDPYMLFAPSLQNRQEWGIKIIEAKTRHAKALYAQNAEPFKLRVIADSAFYYDYGSTSNAPNKMVMIEGTPMDRAIKEVERKFKDTGRPGPVCRAKVNCSTSFTTTYPGKHVVAVGTDYGVYVSEIDNPRGWTKAINIPRVTQVAVLEEFNLFLLISSGSLIAYHLDVVCSAERANPNTDAGNSKKAPQKLSGSRDVGFFAIGRMKERTLVFYKKKDGLSSVFKVLEPVFQKSTEKKRGMFKRGQTEFFREYTEFYIPTDCSGINLFQNSLAVSTSRGFEVLTLDKKQTFSVPDLRAPEVANIATHIENQQTLGMLRLSDQEFLLCYEKCAVYVNKHGDVSRSVIMNFVGRARCAALYGAYLVLFDSDFVEVRNAQNGRLKQIIAGRDVKCLDDGGGGTISGGSLNSGVVNGVAALGAGSRTVKLVMQHPETDRMQVVVELVLNEGLRE